MLHIIWHAEFYTVILDIYAACDNQTNVSS